LGLLLLSSIYCVGLSDAFNRAMTTPRPIDAETTKVAPDQPLMVSVINIGDNYAVFNITGSNTVDGLPVVDLNVKYSIDGISNELNLKPVFKYYSDVSGKLQETVKIPDLEPGRNYHFQFSAVNAMKQMGPPSKDVSVLLLPPTPDISIEHPLENKLIVKWGENKAKTEDYFMLTVEKKSALGCGYTLNITSCFGNKYSLDDLEVGQTYRISMMSHNPTGYSEPVVVSYPIN